MDRQDECCDATPATCDQDRHARFRLLTAAADIFDRKGYAAASVREIVERAGITKPVLYYHYGSKEGLLLAILEEGARVFEDAITRVLARPGTARERLVILCDAIFTLFKEHTSAVRVAHAVYFGPRDGLPAFDFERFDLALNGAVRRLFEEGMASGELREAPIDDLVLVINGVIAVCTDIQLSPRATTIDNDRVRRVLDLIFDGLSSTDTKEK